VLAKQLDSMFYKNMFHYLLCPCIYFETNLFSILSDKAGMLKFIPILAILAASIIVFCNINRHAKKPII